MASSEQFCLDMQIKSRSPSPGAVERIYASLTRVNEVSPVPEPSNCDGSNHTDFLSPLPDPSNPILSVTSEASDMPVGLQPLGDQAAPDTAANVPRVVSTLSSSFAESQSHGSLALQPVASVAGSTARSAGTKPSAVRKRRNTKATRGEPTTVRRQKRLERNRESARLSRRRRKQYLEILEERVTQLSEEMDQGRRAHVSQAVQTVVYKRRDLLEGERAPVVTSLHALDTSLARTSQELMLTNTFQFQQLKSLANPPSTRYILWLTLQNHAFYRGGRAASERLSAARIGERMLQSGTDRAAPAQSMWPLFCNDVVLSYDQEEKVRVFQRSVLQSHASWLERHSAFASGKVMDSAHDAVQAVSLRLGQRERLSNNLLTEAQRIKFLAWAARNRERISYTLNGKLPRQTLKGMHKISRDQHKAANLYVLNQRLQMVLHKIPRAAPLVSGLALKKLSRRPLFESLGCVAAAFDKKDADFDSAGSLKRSASEMSMEAEERQQAAAISPQDAEEAAAPLVEKMFGHVRDIIPPTPRSFDVNIEPSQIPAPTPLASISARPSASPQKVQSVPAGGAPATLAVSPAPLAVAPAPLGFSTGSLPAASAPLPASPAPLSVAPVPLSVAPAPFASAPGPAAYAPNPASATALMQAPLAPWPNNPPEAKHTRKSSFLPPQLNVVPEEMWPADGADEFLMNLVDEDWAIGAGVDMDVDS